MSEPVKPTRPRVKRRGVLRFVCFLCGFTVHPSPGVSYQGANQALGLAGWRIEHRQRNGQEGWVPVCNQCATPEPKPALPDVIPLPPPLQGAP